MKTTLFARYRRVGVSIVSALAIASGTLLVTGSPAKAAACAAPSTDYGSATSTVSIPSTATYRIWSRMQVPDTTNNTYLLEVDGSTCYNVGGGNIATGSWQWISYRDGNPSSRTDLSLTQGNHTLKFIGNKPNVKLDRVIFASDLSCTPTDAAGSQCNVPSDTTAPTVSLTSPNSGATVKDTVTLSATASDNTAVTKVEFYIDSTLVNTDTSSPYSYSWSSKSVTNDTHRVTAKAYDAAGNIGTASNTVTVQNGDVDSPTTPGNVSASATAYNAVKVQWSASTDNVGVTGYSIIRNGVPVATVGAVTSYNDSGLNAATTYQYQVAAMDAAGNKSTASTPISVTTPSPVTPDTQAPTVPGSLAATVVSSSQVNLTWSASTDNIGVAAYDVYRATGSDAAQKIASVTTTSYGDANLAANTTYNYYLKARDSAGNTSAASNTIPAQTEPDTTPTTDPGVPVVSSISGKITSKQSGKAISYAYVVLSINGKTSIYQANSRGVYYMRSLVIGTYTPAYKAKGFYTHTETLTLIATPLVKDVGLDKK